MTPAQTVTITAACPECGTDATWTGTIVQPGGATAYEFDCPKCDGWTVADQLARRATTVPARRLPTVPPTITRNPLLRMLQRALDRRAA